MSWYRLLISQDEIAKMIHEVPYIIPCTKRIREPLNSCKNWQPEQRGEIYSSWFTSRFESSSTMPKKKKSSIFKSNLYILFIFDKFHPRLLLFDWSWHIIIPHVVNYLIVDALGSHLISCKDCVALSRNCIVLMSLSLSLLEWRSYPFLSPLFPPFQIQRGQYQHSKVLGNANRRHSGLKQFSPHHAQFHAWKIRIIVIILPK